MGLLPAAVPHPGGARKQPWINPLRMLFELHGWQITAILASYLFAATAKGVTGLGFTTTCLPILVLLLGLKDALPLVIIPSIYSNIVVMRQAGGYGEALIRFWPMLLALVPGLALGLWALAYIDGPLAGAFLGGMMLVWCAFTFAKPELSIAAHWERPLAPFTGFITGTINGITGSQVMPMVPFMMMLRLERNLFLQAVNCSFTLSSLVMALGLGKLGLFLWEDVLISAIGVCFVTFGLSLGAAIRHQLSETLFRQGILVMLSLMGLGLIVPIVV
ncbi:sulfite exporter TauE/SafE family protein [Granulosicoccus sp.]|nr:sulfite exporter TauE/SafE family protein [Granulosicoccus sp.]MDB4224446.1 sulfite exporter TauE/SafE family protein [Granulosicoccus sp.]